MKVGKSIILAVASVLVTGGAGNLFGYSPADASRLVVNAVHHLLGESADERALRECNAIFTDLKESADITGIGLTGQLAEEQQANELALKLSDALPVDQSNIRALAAEFDRALQNGLDRFTFNGRIYLAASRENYLLNLAEEFQIKEDAAHRVRDGAERMAAKTSHFRTIAVRLEFELPPAELTIRELRADLALAKAEGKLADFQLKAKNLRDHLSLLRKEIPLVTKAELIRLRDLQTPGGTPARANTRAKLDELLASRSH